MSWIRAWEGALDGGKSLIKHNTSRTARATRETQTKSVSHHYTEESLHILITGLGQCSGSVGGGT